MRLLVANIPLPANRFLVDLNEALEQRLDLVHDHNLFWNMEGEFDVVHLHFPEYLTFEVQKAYQESLSEDLIADIGRRLQYWSENSTLMITRHVLLPHAARSDPLWEKLYETIYRYVKGVVHFAEPSIEEFETRYSTTEFIHGPPRHCVVPHHNYASLPNEVNRQEARQKLNIPMDVRVMLVFGAIRNDQERQLILGAFKGTGLRKKFLLASRWPEKLANVSWIRLKYWLRDLRRWYIRINPRYHFNYGFVEECDTQLYLNAADVLFIPRLHVLNSGNITLGMTFGKVVVGPDSLDVGHLLKQTGNVIFDPDQPETASAAIQEAMNLADENIIGPENRKLALSEWSADQCAQQYFSFYSTLLSDRYQT